MIGEIEYKTEIFKNFIPDDKLSAIKSLVDQFVASANEEHVVHSPQGDYYDVGVDAFNAISRTLPLLPNEFCTSLTLLKNIISTAPHTDTNVPDSDLVSNPKKFARTFIVPLETQETNTITFNEKLPHGSVGKEMINFVSNLPVVNAISDETISKYFSGMDRQRFWINKLSIETIFPWVAGDILVFDRNRIHTGDNHIGKVDKQGIVVWTEIK